MTCVIVDDEPLAIEVLQTYLARLADFELLGAFTNPIEALSFVQKRQVDLVFLDIEMPLFNGLEFIKTLNYRPKIIITTAYRDYAVESFEAEAIDYLVKPIPFHRFVKATAKVLEFFHSTKQPVPAISPVHLPIVITEDLWLKVDKKILRIAVDDILYIESLKDYIRVLTPDNEFVTYQSLNGIQEKLSSQQFLRVHKSFIVALQKIDVIEGNMIRIGKHIIPVGRNFRQELIERIQK